MYVICKRPTKRLVKGAKYKVRSLYNSGNNQRWMEGRLEIEGIGRFSVKNFTDDNGNPVPKTDIIVTHRKVERLKFEDLKVGDIIVCTCDSYKTLIKDGMYKIEKIDLKKVTRPGSTYTYDDNKIKFEGVSRKLKFSSWRFRALSSQELRDISLGNILDGEGPKIIKTTDFRKIDLVQNKNLELVKNLAKAILDESRHYLSIVDWSCQKTGTLLSIKPEDYNELLNMSLRDILKTIEK